uniref:Gustatory receptor n=1 Tax=Syphacia muris TaxID=451379 RepID=A0A0N5AGB9_9BILA
MPSIAALSPYGFKDVDPSNVQSVINDDNCNNRQTMDYYKRNSDYKSMFKAVLENQPTYAHYMKLLALFLIAAVHYAYMTSFLDAFAAVTDYVEMFNRRVQTEQAYILQHQIEMLVDYKKNMWLIVGSMCVSLSTSCFFLLLATTTKHSTYITVMRVVDLIAFGTLPALLFARAVLVKTVTERLPEVLHEMQLYVYPYQLVDSLHCSIREQETVPLCSTVILDSLFPLSIIRYLFVLAVMTIAYLIVAYIVDCSLHLSDSGNPNYRSVTFVKDKINKVAEKKKAMAM